MNRNKLKTYAPQARRDFIQAVTDRAALFGLSAKKTEPMTEQGDVVLIAGKPFPKAVGEKRKKLVARIQKNGFGPTMEAVAFTWFNRLVALRYMELHEYLEHGYRVLSNPAGHSQPELLAHAEHVDLAGLDKQKVIALKLDGTKEEELYRHVFMAQCNALNKAMPFLFAKIDDETELLLPDNLLHSDSLIRKLASEIDEADWQQVEIIGWLYQFYISEKKEEVMGSVVASEDIPAATQLFTPNWIVKYLVQNTLGRQWVATNPASPLVKKPVDDNDKHYFMEYYIEPAEQTPEVQEQLRAITPATLNPEELTLLDPACGSGHILVESYDLFKAIYQERGYRAKDIPALILQKNLYGLEIDDRAAQLAAFALMMKARADDRRIFDGDAKPNVLSLQDSKGLDAASITFALNAPINKDDIPKEYLFEEIQDEKDGLFSKKMLGEKGHVSQADIATLLNLFENAKTLGSLIQIPPTLAAKLPEIEQRLALVQKSGDLTHASAHVLKPFLQQTRFLAQQFDAVVANPPYMGGRNGMNPVLKDYVEQAYEAGKADLFGAFIENGLRFAKPSGYLAMITMEAWMFLPSFKELRPLLLKCCSPWSMLHLGARAFDTISGEIVRTTAFAFQKASLANVVGTYRRLVKGKSEAEKLELLKNDETRHLFNSKNFVRVPESRWAYWLTNAVLNCFDNNANLESVAPVRQGFQTGDNGYFMRYWHEVNQGTLKVDASNKEEVFAAGMKWVPYNKGGEFRKWYGNNDYVVAFDKQHYEMLLVSGNCLPSRHLYFRESVTWSAMGGVFGARLSPRGFTFSAKGACAFPSTRSTSFVLAILNSKVTAAMFEFLAPTLDFNVGSIRQLPLVEIAEEARGKIENASKELVAIAKMDWDDHEESWEFSAPLLLSSKAVETTINDAFHRKSVVQQTRIETTALLESEINRILLDAYGLQSELSHDVADDKVTLSRPDREEDIKRLLSYAIGCMMGRYSLAMPGLIYAHSGNQGFDPSQYTTFRADDDGILPLFDTDWGIRDDATNRFVEFIGVAWPKEHVEENLKFVADSLGPSNGEQPRDTIRRYLANGFYKHHLSMYKKRPIYWLFSSGKQRAFQCLVYLHRYNEGTLARMRTEYVIPVLGKMNARLEHLQGPTEQKGQGGEIAAATSTTIRRKLEKERDAVKKQIAELQAFDERLRHYADQRITFNLDDGVKGNYAKFSDPDIGDILADVKVITGGGSDE